MHMHYTCMSSSLTNSYSALRTYSCHKSSSSPIQNRIQHSCICMYCMSHHVQQKIQSNNSDGSLHIHLMKQNQQASIYGGKKTVSKSIFKICPSLSRKERRKTVTEFKAGLQAGIGEIVRIVWVVIQPWSVSLGWGAIQRVVPLWAYYLGGVIWHNRLLPRSMYYESVIWQV